MNKIYRIIWNSRLAQWVVTSELGCGKIKGAMSKVSIILNGSALIITGLLTGIVAPASATQYILTDGTTANAITGATYSTLNRNSANGAALYVTNNSTLNGTDLTLNDIGISGASNPAYIVQVATGGKINLINSNVTSSVQYLYALSAKDVGSSIMMNGGTINVVHTDGLPNVPSVGLVANGASITLTDTTINTNGNGLSATTGGIINIDGKSAIHSTYAKANNSGVLSASGVGSAIRVNGTEANPIKFTSLVSGPLISVSSGAELSMNHFIIDMNTSADTTTSAGIIPALKVNSNASTTLIENGIFNVKTIMGDAISSSGINTTVRNVDINVTQINDSEAGYTSGVVNMGYSPSNAADQRAQTNVIDSNITMTGQGVIGAQAQGAYASLKVTGTTINTTGAGSAGLFSTASSTAPGAEIIADNVTINSDGGFGVLAQSFSSITLTNSTVNSSLTGLYAYAANVYATDTHVTTTGDNGYGIRSDASTGAGLVTVANSGLVTSGAGAHGVLTSFGGTARLSGTSMDMSGSGAAAVYMLGKATDINTFIADAGTSGRVSFNLNDGAGVLVRGGTNNISLTDIDLTTQGNLFDVQARRLTGTDTPDLDNPAIVNFEADNTTLIGGSILSDGSTLNVKLSNGSEWTTTDDAVVSTLTLTDSTLEYSGLVVGMPPSVYVPKTLTITGNYVSDGGRLILNTVLGNDSSVTDKLVVKGDTAGHTDVTINNLGGNGNLTAQGIEIVQVEGNSIGTFGNSKRIVAGSYDYSIRSGSLIGGADVKNWYLISNYIPPEVPDGESGRPVDPIPVYRPETGSYMANMAAASKLFNLRLEDREGRAENSSMWLRQQGSRTKFRDSSGQIKTATNTYLIQGGGEFAQTQFSETDRLGVGLMLGYGQSDSQSGNKRSGYDSRGKVDGYSGGVYATWYKDANTLNGLYADSWVQYSLLKGEVNGDQLSSERYDMSGLSASLESGYRIPVYQGDNGNVFVIPQAQITWNGIKADDHTEANRTRVSSDGNNNVQTRLGVKISRDGVNDMDKGRDKLFSIYAEVNWLHNTERASVTMDGVTTKQAGNINIGELKLGAEGHLNNHVNLWTNVAQQLGDEGYSDTALTVGFKYKF